MPVVLMLLALTIMACSKGPASPTAPQGNTFINQTTDPYYRGGNRTYANALLVEFGVRGTLALVGIVLNTDQPYVLYDKGFGIPKQKDIIPPDPKQGNFTTGAAGNVTLDSTQPKTFRYKSDSEVITNFASLYVYLESNKPIKVVRAEFDGKTFELVGDKLFPRP